MALCLASSFLLATGHEYHCCHAPCLDICSVANTAAKQQNWATFDLGATGKKWVPQFADPITVNVISMGLPVIGLLQTLANF